MQIPLLSGKFACNGGKGPPDLQNYGAFSAGCGPISVPASSGIAREVAGEKSRPAAELQRNPRRRDGAVAPPKFIRLIIRVTGDTIAFFGKM
jgi:hypothetical protein